jgi:hypothetical protein
MSLSRFTPHLSRAFRLPMEQPAPFLRGALPWLAVALAAHLLTLLPMKAAPLAAFILNALAVGGFAVAWMRFVAFGETPRPLALGLRPLLFMVAYQVALMFESIPQPFLQMLLVDVKDGQLLAVAGVQLFQLLIGGFFLVLPHIALATRQEAGGTRLQRMVLAGGLGVGMGYVLGGLPFLVMNMLWDDVAASLPAGGLVDFVSHSVRVMVNFAAVAVMSGYFAQVWQDLKDADPFAPAGSPPDEPEKPRRTERLSKKKG